MRALPRLRPLLPVAVPLPRYVGALVDGATPFTVERRLPGVRPAALDGIACPPRTSSTGALGLEALPADPRTDPLTGIVDGDLQLGPERLAVQADLAALL